VIDTHFSSKTAKEDKPCDYRLLHLSFNEKLERRAVFARPPRSDC
jgi:hypothetical protein